MHTVDVGIGSDNNFIIPQTVQSVFNIEGGLQQVEFLVLINDLFSQAVAVKRFTA